MENEVGAQAVLHCHGAPGWMDVKKTRELAKGASFSFLPKTLINNFLYSL